MTTEKKVWREYSIDVPLTEGVTAEFANSTLTVKGAKGEISKKMKFPYVTISVEGNSVKIETKRFTQRQKKIMHTYRAHVNNMSEGVTNGYTYKLKVVFSKFPITVELKGKTFNVKNFLGEKVPRSLQIIEGPKVEVKGADITVTGIDKEVTGQVAASIEQLTRITHLDRRVIQDGIYITEKPGKIYE